MLPEEQESGQEIMLQENTHNLPGSIQAICMQEHENENKTLAEMMNPVQKSEYPTEEIKWEKVQDR